MPESVTANLYPAHIFYDGECPLCRREVDHYRRLDRQQRLIFIDIASAHFDAHAFNLDPQRVHQVMHAQTADGATRTELDAFRTIWRAMPLFSFSRLLLLIFSLPGMNFLGGIAYRWFARNRHRLTGRCENQSCKPRTR